MERSGGQLTQYDVRITDCDHSSVDVEKKVLDAIAADMKLCQCKTEQEIIEQCSGADGLINQYAPLTRNVLSQLKNVKVISRYGVGLDNVDVEAATDYGIQICHVPDYGVDEVSHHAMALMYALTRKIVLLANDCRNGGWDYTVSVPITRMKGKVCGVCGLGRIGSAFAEKAHGVGLKVISCDPREGAFQRLPFVERVSFQELLTQSDIISVHCPLTPETHHLFDEKAFRSMKDTALIINTARGPIIEGAAITKALAEGWIAGAALDVMEVEPPGKENPLFKFENFIATPHIAWYSEQASEELKRKAAEEVARVLTGEKPHYPANRVVVD